MGRIEQLEHVRFDGALEAQNVSAVAMFNQFALIVSDEAKETGNLLQVLEPVGKDFRAVKDKAIPLDLPGLPIREMDLEGLAVSKETVYVVGSHSQKRGKVDPDEDYQSNRKALTSEPKAAASRDVLFRCTLTPSAAPTNIEQTSLRDFLNRTEPFKSYTKNASKENGVDIEGLAVHQNRLYIGFRGPVLRGNFTPVLTCKYDDPIDDPQVLFVNLGGRGIRELTHVRGGMIILAGPVGDGDESYQLYFWDGIDGVPGENGPTSAVEERPILIGEFPLPAASESQPAKIAKPEGLTLINEDETHWELLVVFDGLKNGHATRYRVEKESFDGTAIGTT